MLNIAKVQVIRCVASYVTIPWHGSMGWNMEKDFCMEWKVFAWNGRKFPIWNMEKPSPIPCAASVHYRYHSLSQFLSKHQQFVGSLNK